MIQAIRDTAFVTTEYPVILSFENHCRFVFLIVCLVWICATVDLALLCLTRSTTPSRPLFEGLLNWVGELYASLNSKIYNCTVLGMTGVGVNSILTLMTFVVQKRRKTDITSPHHLCWAFHPSLHLKDNWHHFVTCFIINHSAYYIVFVPIF